MKFAILENIFEMIYYFSLSYPSIYVSKYIFKSFFNLVSSFQFANGKINYYIKILKFDASSSVAHYKYVNVKYIISFGI